MMASFCVDYNNHYYKSQLCVLTLISKAYLNEQFKFIAVILGKFSLKTLKCHYYPKGHSISI